MPSLFHGGLFMPIHKRVEHPAHPGIKQHLVLPAFSFEPTDALAQLIVDAWANPGQLLNRDPKSNLPTQAAVQEATQKVNAAGFDLTRAVVITEAEHDSDYIMQSDDEIVFVLPNKNRVKTGSGRLLEAAKFLMACTPNGI
jgi:hypothetical protein